MARLVQKAKPSGHKILIVDDVEEVLDSTRMILERDGHEIQTAISGAEGIEKVRSWEPHVLILDYFMPGMTGEEVVIGIRPFNREVQIVLHTGYASEKPPREMLRKLDIQGYHDKSEGPEKLLLWVDVALKACKTSRMLWQMLNRTGLNKAAAPPPPPKPEPVPDDPWAQQAAVEGRGFAD